MKEVEGINKEDLIDILDRTIGFVQNIDNKSSIMIALSGAILTLFFTTEGIKLNYFDFAKDTSKYSNCMMFLFIVFICSIIAIVLGIIFFIMTIKPTTKDKDKSNLQVKKTTNIFFHHIAKNSLENYYARLSNYSKEELKDDYIYEIYINSKIAERKYNIYKCAINISVLGYTFFFIILLIFKLT